MQTPVSHKILDQQFWLTTDRTIFWEEEKALIVSDLHFGKTGHFRKSGIAIPASVYKEDLQRLVVQIQYFQPRELIIVGDMFHSHANKELELFLKWRSDLSDIKIRLIRGNHDILHEEWYEKAGIQLSPQTHSRQHFHFVHDISDHLQGKDGIVESKNFGKKYAVLPAFSRFTGVAMIYPEAEEQVFAIVNQELIRLH